VAFIYIQTTALSHLFVSTHHSGYYREGGNNGVSSYIYSLVAVVFVAGFFATFLAAGVLLAVFLTTDFTSST